MNTQEKIIVPRDLSLRLLHWHSSMYDPIYAVGSCGLGKCAVQRDVFESALDRIQDNLADEKNFLHDKAELREISLQMRSVLGSLKEDRELRECIANAMARSYWALAWGNEAEEREEDTGMGADLIEIAPQTPQRALDAALEDIEQLEKDHGKTLRELYEPYKKMGPYDFGHELAMSVSGYGGDLDIKTHWTELYYYNFADEWIAEDP